MRVFVQIIISLMLFASAAVYGQTGETAAAETAAAPQAETKAVTAVYGVTADDYLPEFTADDYLNPKLRRSPSRPSFDLPDAFYFIGGPVFLLILLRVLVMFITAFEEKRKEEERQVASEQFNPD